jgi:hypothetical protein
MLDRLEVKLIIPGKELPPNERHIVAVVNDGVETVQYRFGRHQSLQHIWEMVPRMYMDSKFEPKRKQKFNQRKKAV